MVWGQRGRGSRWGWERLRERYGRWGEPLLQPVSPEVGIEKRERGGWREREGERGGGLERERERDGGGEGREKRKRDGERERGGGEVGWGGEKREQRERD